jgi:hypothetical protein
MKTLSKDHVATKPKRMIDTNKLMVTIIWNPYGAYVVDLFLDGAKFNKAYFLETIAAPLQSGTFPVGRKKQERKLSLRRDIAVPFTVKGKLRGLRLKSHQEGGRGSIFTGCRAQ